MDALYRDYILDHYKNPRNFGELDPRDAEYADDNPLCGDELGVHVRMDKGRIAEIRFHGEGCAISQASASIISEELVGMALHDVRGLGKSFVLDELGIDISPARLKCALLALKVVKGAVVGDAAWPGDEAAAGGPEPTLP